MGLIRIVFFALSRVYEVALYPVWLLAQIVRHWLGKAVAMPMAAGTPPVAEASAVPDQKKDEQPSSLHQETSQQQQKQKQVPPPELEGYQLVGDSQLLRLAENVLGLTANYDEVCGARALGLCVSGQTTGQLADRVATGRFPVAGKVVLMIGTNDLLRSTPVPALRRRLEVAVSQLCQSGARRLVALTVPPVPRLASCADHWRRLDALNDTVRGLAPAVRVADTTHLFVDSEGGRRRCREELFEHYYGDTQRVDRVHLNTKGLRTLRDYLLTSGVLR